MTTKLKEQIKELKIEHNYDDARTLLNENSIDADELRALAECNYKDLELHRDYSYPEALKFLDRIVDDNNPKETLCLRGAVYKRKWEYKANINDLHESIKLYEKAYNSYKEDDEGYGGINASYL
ncbi:MAG: hypothetical protein GQ474_01295, partial [Sulfurimonas sp.]|nr:hypothetical protein [Sulfurimonas sp.]